MSKEAEIRALLTGESQEPEAVQPEEETPVAEETQTESEPGLEVDTEQAQEDESPQAAAGEDDGEEAVTLTQVAEQLDIDPAILYGMRVSIDGHAPMTLSELKDAAQGTLDKREDAKQAENELATRLAELERRESGIAELENLPGELIKAEAEVARTYQEFASVDWPKLEAQNPGQAALQRQKLVEAYQIAQYNRDRITNQLETARVELVKQRQQAHQVSLQGAVETLRKLVPEWKDEAVQKREQEQIVEHYVGAGVSEGMIRSIADPQLVKVLRDYWKLQVKLKESEPVKKTPRVIKPDVLRDTQRGRKVANQRNFERAAKSRDMRVKDKAIAELLKEAGVV